MLSHEKSFELSSRWKQDCNPSNGIGSSWWKCHLRGWNPGVDRKSTQKNGSKTMEFSFCSWAGTGRLGMGVSKIQAKSLQTAGLSVRVIMKKSCLKGCSSVKEQDEDILQEENKGSLKRGGKMKRIHLAWGLLFLEESLCWNFLRTDNRTSSLVMSAVHLPS